MNREVIQAIAAEVARLVNQPETLWDVEDVAKYLRYQPRVVREKLVCRPGFPQPMRLPGMRWEPDAIREWATAHLRQRDTSPS